MFAQVTKSDATPATLDGSITTINFNYAAGDFSGCTGLTEVEVGLTLTVTDNGSCNPGGFGVHGDIAVSLESPSGTVVHLVQDFTGILIGSPPVGITYQDVSFPNIVNQTATYDDDATLLADDQTSFGTGIWRPHNPLSAFDGESPVGTWILRVADGRVQNFPDFTCYLGSSITVSCGSGLPVELTSFEAERQERNVLLNWVTQTETNNKGFKIERSSNLNTWEELSFVTGVGNAIEANNYKWIDSAPIEGMNYYRLTQVDIDGKETIYSTEAVNFSNYKLFFDVVPNPNNGNFTIRSNDWKEGQDLKVRVLNSEGKICFVEEFRSSGGVHEMSLELLDSGVYTIQIVGEDFVSFERFVIDGRQ